MRANEFYVDSKKLQYGEQYVSRMQERFAAPTIKAIRPFLHDTNEFWVAEKVDADGHSEPVIVVQV